MSSACSVSHTELESVAKRGYAIDDEEDNEGVFCVGSAIFDRSARCVGAVSITGLKLDLRPEAYRAALRPQGPNPATWLLIAGRGGPGRAILARRV